MADTKGSKFYVHVEGSVRDIAKRVVETQEQDDAFFICDLTELRGRVELWRQQLPRVAPYFAINSCTDPVVLRTLAMEGVSFDCSNKREIQVVLGAGVDSSRIIYANPAKQASHLKFAESVGVTMMTFDCPEELEKITDKNARLLLRFSAHDGGNEERMARKYGCNFDQAENILRYAHDRGHTIIGIAYHIWGRLSSGENHRNGIRKAKQLFDFGARLGINMTVLDIGGGYRGSSAKRDYFIEVCESLRLALEEHFPESSGIQIIAEPGQYMVTSPYNLIVNVVAKRTRPVSVDGELCELNDVYINESCKNCIPEGNYKALVVKYHPLNPPYDRAYNHLTTVWGATCHPTDKFEDMVQFFEVTVNEWLLMDNVGAYGLVRACGFNGIGYPPTHYRTTEDDAPRVREVIDASPITSGYSQPAEALRKTSR